jgi:hypothetical protein
MQGVPRISDSEQGTLPFVDLDDELSGLRDEVARLRAENARLLRLLELTPKEARPPGPVQTGVFDAAPGPCTPARRRWPRGAPEDFRADRENLDGGAAASFRAPAACWWAWTA